MSRFYTTNEVLSTTKWIQIDNPKEFVIIMLNADNKTFDMNVVIQKWEKMPMHFKKQVLIQIKALLFDKFPTKIVVKYSNYSNVFSTKIITKLPGTLE